MALGLSSLPYDVLRILARLIDGADVTHVLSTCKDLHLHMKDDAIWQEHCSRYQITDLPPGTTFFLIYSEVAHKYGPLLGLWACDHPYYGFVVEFRLATDGHSIVGETWQFGSGSPITNLGG